MRPKILGFGAILFGLGCARPPEAMKDVSGCLAPGASAQVAFSGQEPKPMESSFDGFGCNSVAANGEAQAIHLRPQVATRPEETHAGLVLGPDMGDRVEVSCRQLTTAQLRQNSPPNPHEVGWLVWQFEDNGHFYYLMAKPNGWELGKRDPKYPGGQRFLATGETPAISVGTRCELRVVQSGERIEAYVDGRQVASLRDEERPYLSGRVGVYCEDADVYFDSLAVAVR